MPPSEYTAAGDINIGGDAVGGSKHNSNSSQGGPTAREWEAVIERLQRIEERVGKLESMVVSIRLEMAVARERSNFATIGLAALAVIAGVLSVIVGQMFR